MPCHHHPFSGEKTEANGGVCGLLPLTNIKTHSGAFRGLSVLRCILLLLPAQVRTRWAFPLTWMQAVSMEGSSSSVL